MLLLIAFQNFYGWLYYVLVCQTHNTSHFLLISFYIWFAKEAKTDQSQAKDVKTYQSQAKKEFIWKGTWIYINKKFIWTILEIKLLCNWEGEGGMIVNKLKVIRIQHLHYCLKCSFSPPRNSCPLSRVLIVKKMPHSGMRCRICASR